MTGKDLIKAILDQGMVDEEIRVVGVTEDGVTIDDTVAISVTEISMVEMDDGYKVAALVVPVELAE